MSFTTWNYRFIFVSITILSTVACQLCLKKGLLQYTISGNYTLLTLFEILKNQWVLLGFFLGFVAACSWIITLSRLPLSYAYPFISITFPLVVVLSSAIFDEPIALKTIIGLVLIVIGLIVASAGYSPIKN